MPQEPAETMQSGQAHRRAALAIARGDFAAAYDIAVSAIAGGDESDEIRHQQVLALARMGDVETAIALFGAHGLDRSTEPDELLVGARLLKDRAFAAAGRARAAAMGAAADAFRAVFALSGEQRPGINAASLALLAGRVEEARESAGRLLMHPDITRGGREGVTSHAELLLVLGRVEQAEALLLADGPRPRAAAADRATTMRQFAALAAANGLSPDRTRALLAAVRPPAAIHFIAPPLEPAAADEAALAAAVTRLLADRDVGFAYGSLAAGAEIVVAEAVIARGGELHVVLPFDEEDFAARAVRPAGGAWEARYWAAIAAAASVSTAGPANDIGDAAQRDHSARLAMGLARLKGRHLRSELFQLAVEDGAGRGLGDAMAAWAACGGEAASLALGGRPLADPVAPRPSADERMAGAILFTDFPGFSRLSESALPAFWNGVMRRVADVLDAHGDAVECRNAWGDALYAVTRSAAVSAEIALSLQASLAQFDYASIGLKAGLGMRIGAHFGTVYRARDHVTGQISFYGNEVSRAARIEPVTPPGAVFVTEPFAAMLMLEGQDRFVTRYVGRIELAKGAGSAPMYRLSRA